MNRILTLLMAGILFMLAGCGYNQAGIKPSQPPGNMHEETQVINLSDNDISYTGDGITVMDSTVRITKGGKYDISGTLSNGNIIIDTKEAVLLVLNGVDIKSARNSAIAFVNTGNAVIEIAKGTKNHLSDEEGKAGKVKKTDTDGNKNAVIYSNSNIELYGDGELHITGNNRGGIHSGNKLNILSGIVYISAKNQGIFAQNELAINGGEISIGQSKEGMECKGEITINNGNIQITSKDDALNAENNLVVNGGYIYADSGGDGFDSNGNMTINGGEIYIFARVKKNSALDVSDGAKIGNFTINGGTIVAAGGNTKIEVEKNSKQHHVWIYPSNEIQGEPISVNSESGEKIAELVFPKPWELLFVSTEKINPNEKYILYMPAN